MDQVFTRWLTRDQFAHVVPPAAPPPDQTPSHANGLYRPASSQYTVDTLFYSVSFSSLYHINLRLQYLRVRSLTIPLRSLCLLSMCARYPCVLDLPVCSLSPHPLCLLPLCACSLCVLVLPLCLISLRVCSLPILYVRSPCVPSLSPCVLAPPDLHSPYVLALTLCACSPCVLAPP